MTSTSTRTALLGAMVAASIGIAGCVPTGQVAGTSPVTLQAIPSDLALSCGQLQAQERQRRAQLAAFERQGATRRAQGAMTDMATNAVLGGVLGMGARGGIDGIRAAGGVISGVQGIQNAAQGPANVAEAQRGVALARRAGQLQNAIVQKGC